MSASIDKTGGFTLIELVTSMIVLAVLALVAAPLITMTGQLFTFHTDRAVMEEAGTYAAARMTREIRRVRDDLSLITGSRNEISFVDVDGATIRYRLVGNQIRRTENGTERVFLDGVAPDGLVFFFYHDDNADDAVATEAEANSPIVGLGVKTNARYVKFWITLQRGGSTYTIRDAVRLRNVQFRESEMFL